MIDHLLHPEQTVVREYCSSTQRKIHIAGVGYYTFTVTRTWVNSGVPRAALLACWGAVNEGLACSVPGRTHKKRCSHTSVSCLHTPTSGVPGRGMRHFISFIYIVFIDSRTSCIFASHGDRGHGLQGIPHRAN